jgi:periplasmic protein TonB
MSYKSLLFCPDERTARTVTQVLRELEFAVEPANDPFSAVKKLTDERFDALVVDCQNEQDASLLFKTARDSSQNHSSLSVAVVEGQAGVAKAFRIGANLVLSKPINIEQSKGTLRVARGLLRKNEAKPAAPAVQASTRPVGDVSMFTQAAVRATSLLAAESARAQDSVAAPSANAEAPFSALEVESDPAPATEAAEVAVLESLPELAGNPTRHSLPSMLHTQAQPIAAGTSGQGAAVAPALAKDAAIELKTGSMPPMVTNEPIVAEGRFQESFSSADVPAFSSLESTREGGAGKKFFKVAVIVLALGVAGYFGWQKLQPLQRLQRMRAAHAENTSVAVAPAPVATPTPMQTPASIQPAEKPEPPVAAESEISAAPAHTPPQSDDLETIEVQELPMSREAKPSAAPKAQPLIVKPDTGVKKSAKPAQLAPPSVQVSSVNVSDLALTSLATTNAAIPKLAPTSVRVSQGVSQGLLLKKVPPVYPPMALQLRKEGAVELLTTISKQGLITNIKVLSGDSMLAKPAVDAVRQWKYRPYLLNGEPVEIQTQITINFKAPR